MNIVLYQDHNWLFADEDGICTKITTESADARAHRHNYYEIFLVISGQVTHNVNHKKFHLKTGSLNFIRPDDFHHFTSPSPDLEFYNLLTSKHVMDLCLNFLGTGSNYQNLLMSPMPPEILLTSSETMRLLSSFEQLIISREINVERFNALLRSFIVNCITDFYLFYNTNPTHNIPAWLNILTLEMQKKQNYQEGLASLYRISNKSPEYLCRVFKKHLNKTPTEFINDIRLTNAKLSLEYTNMSIVNICGEIGFENISHFYHLFKKETGLSPNEFRKLSLMQTSAKD